MSKVIAETTYKIKYAGLTLTVAKNGNGQDVVPLKPITDLFDLTWKVQREKLSQSEDLTEYFGICYHPTMSSDGQKREQMCILLSRVAAFLMSLSPEKIKAAGNIGGAKYLREKQAEWADALHDYEQLGVAVNTNHHAIQSKIRKDLFAAIGLINKTSDKKHRMLIDNEIKKIAGDLGHPYQPDMLDQQ